MATRKPSPGATINWALRKVLPWTQEQAAFFAAVRAMKRGEAIGLEASAGTGKTTSAVEAAWIILEKNPSARILFVAFNNRTVEELATRLPNVDTVKVKTTHSHGFAAVRRTWQYKTYKMGEDVSWNYAKATLGTETDAADDRHLFTKCIALCKERLVSDKAGILALMGTYKIEPESDAQAFAAGIESALANMRKAPGENSFGQPSISFTDQLWLGVINSWKFDTYDYVFVDEAQDLSPVKAEIVKRSVAEGGNIIFVGDPYQAIYGFAGAAGDSFQYLVDHFNAKTLPLTYTRRCGKKIVAFANEFVKDYHAFPDQHDGEIVQGVQFNDLVSKITAGDTVISRTNAPLVRLFFRLLKVHAQGSQKVCLLGRDFGDALAHRIRGWQKKAKSKSWSVNDLLNANAEWCANERARIEKRGGSADYVIDQADAIVALCEDLHASVSSPESVSEVLKRCEFFKDDQGKETIVLSSTHKYKGGERDRVYALWSTYLPAKTDNAAEERRLAYVAATRAIKTLVLVEGTGKGE